MIHYHLIEKKSNGNKYFYSGQEWWLKLPALLKKFFEAEQ